MKLRKFLLPLLLATTVLSSCGSGSNQFTAVDKDLEFQGISIDNTFESEDYKFKGVLADLSVNSWVVAGDEVPFTIESKLGEDPRYTVKFDNPELFEVKTKLVNDVTTHFIVGQKTGGTTIKIYADQDLIYRAAINCRMPIRDNKLMFKKLSQADYWYGLLASSSHAGNYKMIFEEDPKTGINNIATLSMHENLGSLGTVTFRIDVDKPIKETFKESIHVLQYQCTVLDTTSEVTPVSFDVSLTGDMIYLVDSVMLTDIFVPKYL